MKKLTTLILGGLLTINSVFGFETDKYKHIPRGSFVIFYDLNLNGKMEIYWWDKNKDKFMQDNEVFLDLNEDGIIDISYEEVKRMYFKLKSPKNPNEKRLAKID